MKIELLTTFLEVSNTLHVRIAAENLHLTQAAVSSRLKLLEDTLGAELFDRSGRRLALTPEGHRLIKHCHEMLNVWQKLKHDMGGAFDNTSQLVVGAPMSIWDTLLEDWIQKIARNLEEVSLLTHAYGPIELRKQLANRLIDVGFLFEPPSVEGFTIEKVATVPLILVSSDSEATTENLPDLVQVDYGESIGNRIIEDALEALPIKHVMNQPRLALNFILSAGGSAYLPKQLCFEAVRKKLLFRVKNAPTHHRTVSAVYLSRSNKRELIEDSLSLFPYLNS